MTGIHELHELLRTAMRHRRRAETIRGASQAAAVSLVALVVVLLVDAVLGLRAIGLVTLDLALLAIGLAGVWYVARVAYRNRFRDRRAAVLVESASSICDNRLINALDLSRVSTSAERAAAGSEALRLAAVARGAASVDSIVPDCLVDARRVRRGLVAGFAGLLFVCLAYTLMPRVFHAVVPRLASPYSGLPPYTPVDFDVSTEPRLVVVDRPATIRARLSGSVVPDRASVVFTSAADANEKRVPMTSTPAPEGAESEEGAWFVLRMDRVERSRDFYVDTPDGRSRVFRLEARPVPQFESVVVTYRYPGYTGWNSTSEPLSAAGIRAIEGTLVTLAVESNVPLRDLAGKFEIATDGKSVSTKLKVDPTNSRRVTADVELAFSGALRAELVGADGTPSEAPLEGVVTVVPDAAPKIEIVEPPRIVVAAEDWTVDVKVAASDDVAVERIVLQRAVNGWGPFEIELERLPVSPTLTHAAYAFDLPALGARPGDVITYFAIARDNRPGGGQLAESEIHVIQVISKDEYLEYARADFRVEALTAEWAELQNRLEALAEMRRELEEEVEKLERLQKQLAAGDELSESEREEMRRIQRMLEEFARGTDALARDLQERADQPSLFEFEESYQEQLRRLAKQLDGQTNNAKALAAATKRVESRAPSPAGGGPAGGRPGAGLAPLSRKFLRESDPFTEEQQLQNLEIEADLEKIRLASEMSMHAERVRLVILQQRELTERLAQFRDSGELSENDRRRANDLADEQDTLRKELDSAARDLRELATHSTEKLPRMSTSALGLCDSLAALDVSEDQSKAARRAREGNGRLAHEASESAADKLETLLSDCQSTGGQAGDLDGCLKLPRESMARALRQLTRSRSIPGLGQQGSTGGGFRGSNATMTVLGPSNDSRGKSNAKTRLSGRGGSGRGSATAGVFGTPEDAETLLPNETTERVGADGASAGVPVKYRDVTEAYFRRLAEDRSSR